MANLQWLLGDEVIKTLTVDEVEQSQEGSDFVYESIINYEPKIEDNKKVLKCRFSSQTFQEGSASAEVLIGKKILPDSPYGIQGKLDEPLDIELDMELSPAPNVDNLQWIIEDTNTGDKIMLNPGDENGNFKANELTNFGRDRFKTTLTINKLTNEEIDNKKIHFDLRSEDDG